jgi:hypothetical protein
MLFILSLRASSVPAEDWNLSVCCSVDCSLISESPWTLKGSSSLQSVLLFIDFVWTGEGANFGEGIDAIGGGVDNGRLEGVLPAAEFFSP